MKLYKQNENTEELENKRYKEIVSCVVVAHCTRYDKKYCFTSGLKNSSFCNLFLHLCHQNQEMVSSCTRTVPVTWVLMAPTNSNCVFPNALQKHL